MSTSDREFWFTNHVANPVLRPLLRGWLGHSLGRRLAVLRYRGRRTGRTHELVVQYVREGDAVWIVPGQADRKHWWRNMLEPTTVELWLAGERRSGVATVINSTAGEEVSRGMAAYQSVFPGVKETTAMVRVDIGRVPTDSARGSA